MIVAQPVAALADPAASPLTICNRIADTANIAVGYFSSGINDTENRLTGPFVSRGWWQLAPGQCQTFANPFNARYMFWWVVAKGLNDRGMVVPALADQTPERVHFCVPYYFDVARVPQFTFEDENESRAVCEKGDRGIWVTPQKADTFIESSVNITADSTRVK